MTTDTEALRAQFERRMNLRGWSGANIRRDGLDYSSTQLTEAWHAYQAGHAAAKAATAAPVVGRWYFVTNDGAATLCVDEADARESAAEADIAFPRMAPHRAVQLVPADQLAAAGAVGGECPVPRDLKVMVTLRNGSVRRLARSLRKAAPDHDLPSKALDYLARNGLQCSPLRDGDAVYNA